jgi:25S rRNA (adenine2142-N1)-methyltransferase
MARKRPATKPIPLAPPELRSRKQARRITTQFHRLTRKRDQAASAGDDDRVRELDRAIEEGGGRALYQRASQVSTSYFSTSRWVLGYLVRNGWIHGRPSVCSSTNSERAREDKGGAEFDLDGNSRPKTRSNGREEKRPTRLLEVGAINTELLDASKSSNESAPHHVNVKPLNVTRRRGGGLRVRSIDLRSMHPEIEQADFLAIPLTDDEQDRYDVIVCSMVLNCVTTPIQRGEMVKRLFHFLLPGGLCFITIPKSCLALSPYMDRLKFQEALAFTGLEVLESKETPKIAFFICERPEPVMTQVMLSGSASSILQTKLEKFRDISTIRRGRKYTNDFSIVFR